MGPPKIEVLSSTKVQPAITHLPTTTPLSLIDASVARFTPCGAIWYFSTPTSPALLSPENLQRSLSHTLSAYPQWAGQLSMTPYKPGIDRRKNSERYGRMEMRYGREKDPGVVFVVARIHCPLALPTCKEKSDGVKICDGLVREDILLPRVPLAGYNSLPGHADSSLAVQVTKFEDGGTAVGVQIAHCLADAISLSRFVHDWSATHQSLITNTPVPEPSPIFEPWLLNQRAAKSADDVVPDESVLKIAYELPLHRYDWWASGEESGFGPGAHKIPEVLKDEPRALELARDAEKMPWDTYDVQAPVSHTIIHYTSKELERLWSAAATSPDIYGSAKAGISRHDALVAHIWTLVNRARGPENGDVDSEVHCDVTIGLRTRVSPPLPASFLGSPLHIINTALPWSVASSSPALSRIAVSINATLSRFTPAAVGAQIYAIAHELAPQRLWQAFLGRKHLIVTSWAHTRLYDCDFGTGETPRYVHPIMPLVDGCLQIMEARPKNGKMPGGRWYDDGVDVAIYLEKEAMNRLVQDKHIWR